MQFQLRTAKPNFRSGHHTPCSCKAPYEHHSVSIIAYRRRKRESAMRRTQSSFCKKKSTNSKVRYLLIFHSLSPIFHRLNSSMIDQIKSTSWAEQTSKRYTPVLTHTTMVLCGWCSHKGPQVDIVKILFRFQGSFVTVD